MDLENDPEFSTSRYKLCNPFLSLDSCNDYNCSWIQGWLTENFHLLWKQTMIYKFCRISVWIDFLQYSLLFLCFLHGVNLSFNFASFLFSDPLWEVSCLAGNFFGPRRWTFWTNPDISQTLTGKQKGAWKSWLSFCFSVKAWDTAEKVQKVHLPTERDPKKISRQTGNFSGRIRKQKLCRIKR